MRLGLAVAAGVLVQTFDARLSDDDRLAQYEPPVMTRIHAADGLPNLQLLQTLAERLKLVEKVGMRRLGVIFGILLGLALAAEAIPQDALAQSSGNIVVAQEKSGPGGFFRRLFGGQRRQQQQRQQRGPFKLFPDFDAPEPQAQPRRERKAQPRRERKARTAKPQPREQPPVEKAADAKRALVIGDFMANALAKGLTDAYRQNPNIVVVDVSNGSSGLVRDDYYNWPAKVPELVAEHKPDAILVMMGANDRQTMQTAAGAQAFGGDQWRAEYTARKRHWPMR